MAGGTIVMACRRWAARFGGVLLVPSIAASAAAQERGEPVTPGPRHEQIERALQWESGRVCRDLIDACLDEQGNDLYPTPEFSVSELKCRRVADDRAHCTFLSAMRYGSEVVRRSRCTATLVAGRGGWSFQRDWRRHHTALDCK